MMENEIRNLIRNTLNITECNPSKTLSIPCFILDYSYFEKGNVFGNGICKYSDHFVQIDIYYFKKSDFKSAINLLKKSIKDNFIYPNIDSYYDTTNKFYRATLQFVVQEREG